MLLNKQTLLNDIDEIVVANNGRYEFPPNTKMSFHYYGVPTMAELISIDKQDNRRVETSLCISLINEEESQSVDLLNEFGAGEIFNIRNFIVNDILQSDVNALKKEFKEKDLYVDDISICDEKIYITIEWGDWKHSHAFCNYLLSQKGYKLEDEEVTEEDGSDCYSSIHTYIKK